MNGHPEAAYNHLPLLPPEADIETKPILQACISAARALAELKMAGRLIPNQSVLINTIPLLEAQSSSEIENIVTTRDNLFRYAGTTTKSVDPATKETLRYREALYQGFLALKRKNIDLSLAIQTVQSICRTREGIRTNHDTVIANPHTREIVYTPPQGEPLIREKLRNWEIFANTCSQFDPLIKMAVLHYQFEAIHPFSDGNGRTGRILNILYLLQEHLLEIPVLYLSRHIIQHKSDYYRLLRNVTEKHDWEPWILFMLQGLCETAQWTSHKIIAISKLMEHAREYARENAPKIYTYELIDAIFTQPYCRIQHLVEFNIAKRQTASEYLHRLCRIGILQEVKAGREKIFIHPLFIDLLNRDSNESYTYQQIHSQP